VVTGKYKEQRTINSNLSQELEKALLKHRVREEWFSCVFKLKFGGVELRTLGNYTNSANCIYLFFIVNYLSSKTWSIQQPF